MSDLTTEEINEITDKLVTLRTKIRNTGATVLTPTAEWDKLRKEIALLNKKLNADAKSKQVARDRAARADVASP